jgi:DNA-binding protein H-NS
LTLGNNPLSLCFLKEHTKVKKPAQAITSQFKALPIDEQSSLLNALGTLHFRAKAKRVKELEQEVEKLRNVKPVPRFEAPVKKTRAKPKPTHRSKKDKGLTWSGRGSYPRWMKDEMKALKLKPNAFLIKR